MLTWGFGGSTTLTVEDDALVMRADAEDAETLDRVKDVTGRTWNASARRTAWSLPGSNFLRCRLEHPRDAPAGVGASRLSATGALLRHRDEQPAPRCHALR